MREILFRGKTVHGEWVEGWFVGKTRKAPYNPPKEKTAIIGIDLYCYDVIPETIGQYTGLTDKNGKKIFEGDIVKYGDTLNKVVFEQRNGTAYFGVVIGENETWEFCYTTNASRMEIIGNIHDNPDLL